MPAEELSPTTRDPNAFALRPARRADARRIHRMVRESGVLDVNSCYAYLLLCEHFGDTCLVAEQAGGLVAEQAGGLVAEQAGGLVAEQAGAEPTRGPAGFVTAYRPPRRPEAVFVWQIGVAGWARKRGLAKRMLRALLGLPSCRDAQRLEATIAPSNGASRRLFESLADDLGVAIECVDGFTMTDFDDASGNGHEAEPLYRIGPLPAGRSHPKES